MRNLIKLIFIAFGALFIFSATVNAQTAVEDLMNANEDFKEGHVDQAIIEYTKAIDANPNYAKAYNNRGIAYALEGSLHRAIDDFTLAIVINNKDESEYNNRGHAYTMLGNYKQAILDFNKAIKINPLYIKAYNNRGFAYYKSGRFDKAWDNVHRIQDMNGMVDPNFLNALKSASGEDPGVDK